MQDAGIELQQTGKRENVHVLCGGRYYSMYVRDNYGKYRGWGVKIS
jgi:hypothetical protein